MNIYLASDHAGFELKNEIANLVRGELGHVVEDCGALSYDPDDDYPPIIARAIERLSRDLKEGIESRAIILGASGEGEAVVANRTRGIRAIVYYGKGGDQHDQTGRELDIIASSREHNDANVLSIGARFISKEDAYDAIRRFLSTPFRGVPRHARRIAEIDEGRHEVPVAIVPTVVPKSREDIARALDRVRSFSTLLHIDIDDGTFTPDISWPYESPSLYKESEATSLSIPDGTSLEAHLMVESPDAVGAHLIHAGVRSLIAHAESSFETDTIARWRAAGCAKVGIALKIDSDLSLLEPHIGQADFIMLMSVAEIGAQGAAFDERIFERVRACSERYSQKPIRIDGGISLGTIARLVRAGAREFSVGSYIMNAADPASAYDALRTAAKNAIQ